VLIFGVLEDFENSRCAYLSQVCTCETHIGYLQGAFKLPGGRFSPLWRTLNIPGVLTWPWCTRVKFTADASKELLPFTVPILDVLEDFENSRCAYRPQVCIGEVHSGCLQIALEVPWCRFSAFWMALKGPGAHR